ncbi:hypothetical protein AB4090_03265 [Acidithiobacillus sp. IBUN Pt1247-S3]|uniref:hypothetical protein n=1 Tax=Acidithiobacillus sp. IBUN Pt1247-S3 TaxID=3166642 RepID=UPI0034E60BF1
MDSPGLSAQIGSAAKDTGVLPAAVGGTSQSPVSNSAAASDKATQASGTISTVQMQKSIQKLQGKVAKSQPSYSLEVGLDPNGDHPNQVLIKLSDKVTNQVFFSYYVPAEQVTKAAESSSQLGNLLQQKL